ncbi:hypothetical protein HYH03_011782 [Edaphochlamys debaryana]|uniref:Uncharacterized protein n=1 Tax=Edaphochlamys debaryana TaxID=47281 RepID=A0A836BUK7_9CHLO|nr:hypothetical protein HYH03_011782 [Edaphochlamys debaryana]|eukprot:KAG2489671.1 hypothetical protein HYH03_011782 [Edaphochlamys debaryana]
MSVAGLLLAILGLAGRLGAAHAAGGWTIFNDIPDHWHVFAGAIATVRKHLDPHTQLVWLSLSRERQSREHPPPYGLLDWLGDKPNGSDWHHLPYVQKVPTRIPDVGGPMKRTLSWGPVQGLVCVSPELDHLKACHKAAKVLGAKHVVALIHRGDFIRSHSWFLSLAVDRREVPVHLVALVPHVSKCANASLHGALPVHWATMVAPYTSPQPCESKSCLEGFVVQGSLRQWKTKNGSGLIRNYDGLWEQLRSTKGAASVRIKVLGQGNKRDLALPKELEKRVDFHSGLPFPDYWEIISRSYALAPMHGTSQYLTMRCSSTVLASLTTCVPLIADAALLGAYDMFTKEHVFFQEEGETEVEVMKRVMALPDKELFAKRAAVCRLRDEQLRRSARVLRDLVE